jgi:AraC-like DNA-binding protein
MAGHPFFLSNRPAVVTDALDDVLRRVQLSSTVYFRAELAAPWGVRMAEGRRAPFYLVGRGGCLLKVAGQRPVSLAVGDLAIVPGGDGHVLRSSAAAPVRPLEQFLRAHPMDGLGRVRATGGDGALTDLTGGFFTAREIDGNPLLACLPPLVHLRGDDPETARALGGLGRQIAHELGSEMPGAHAVLARLADLLLIQAIRLVVVRGAPAGWLRGLADPVAGRALALLHAEPGGPWTLTGLARRMGVSRTRLAERFAALVGQPPIQYLTHWRIQLAAQMLRESDTPLAQIAGSLGYTSEFAFNRAFRRILGMPPGRYRRRARR